MTIVAKLHIPLDATSRHWLHEVLDENPRHTLEVTDGYLHVYAIGGNDAGR